MKRQVCKHLETASFFPGKEGERAWTDLSVFSLSFNSEYKCDDQNDGEPKVSRRATHSGTLK